MSDSEFLGLSSDTDVEDLRALTWLPGEFAAAGLEDIRLANDVGSRWLDINVPRLSGYFAPVRAGQLVSVLGQTSQGKSMLAHYMNSQIAKQLSKEGRDREAVFHISVEESIEDMALLALARESGLSVGSLARGSVENVGKLQTASMTVTGTPIFYIGESINTRRNRNLVDALTLSNSFSAIKDICNQTGLSPASITIDYLQALPIDPHLVGNSDAGSRRRLQVRADTYFTRRAALAFGCPIFLLVQAKQTLNNSARKDGTPTIQLPGFYDGEESSAIGQRSDRILSVCLPARMYPIGTTVQLGALPGDALLIKENHFLVKVVKQRGSLPAGKTFLFEVNFDTGELNPAGL